MRVVSVNVGTPREIEWRGQLIETGIFKEPVEGRVAVKPLNLRGDRQADLTVHGGESKAVYAYPHEHYAFWKRELDLTTQLSPGSFGENLTVTGFAEDDVRIGERWRIGTCELAVTEPRVPCFKLAAKFQRADMIRRFLASRRSGWYLRVRSASTRTSRAVRWPPSSWTRVGATGSLSGWSDRTVTPCC
jgi:MOSC domain-containing protein YiiM